MYHASLLERFKKELSERTPPFNSDVVIDAEDEEVLKMAGVKYERVPGGFIFDEWRILC